MSVYQSKEKQSVKDQIVTGLFKELAERPLSEIPVASLIKTAGVARASYYRNFDSKEAILNFYLDRVLGKTEEPDEDTIWTRPAIQENLEEIFQRFEEEKEHFILLFQSGLASYAFDYFSSFADRNGINSPFPWADQYKLPFYSGALTAVLYHWLKSGTKESTTELAELFISFLPDAFFIDEAHN
ncbi:TetR/AcrR family transcriptional regulator [Fructobacillus parabroussonetiae]|uniref:TetR/AcrR family transcriptional regulator n=1 Tax=Fructobacillus parabroussonetiae TaxID=2713174 RepID=A0ABS5QV68_9LACO|nr:TetR/AcrR family transcriptional regulator [Fructobacillus parabroussonetiae]MBS9337001.1 TetR/AcrR family transcriptional regulator [Fructobacillus parabroussonetiae]